MRKIKSFFVPLQLVVLCAVMGAMTSPAHAGIFGVSTKQEIEAGKKVTQQAYKEYGPPLAKNNPMSVRVRAIGRQFAKLSTRKDIPYSYQVLNNEKVLNAFAAPGGPVFVTKKLMETVSNDAELAFVLGHETAHIDRKHIVKAVEKQQKVALGVGILGAIFGYNDNSLFNVFSNVAFTVWSKGYSRDQESQADSYGVRWMSELGFDPQASITMLGKLGKSPGGIGKYLSDHPQNSEREQAAAKEIKEKKLEQVAHKSGGPSLSAAKLPKFRHVHGDFKKDIYNGAASTPTIDSTDNQHISPPLITAQNGKYSVLLAPVGPFGRWAGAKLDIVKGWTIVKRGHFEIKLKVNSRHVRINGRPRTLSVPTEVRNHYLYASIGDLAEGVGGNATWDAKRRGVRVQVGKKTAFWKLQ